MPSHCCSICHEWGWEWMLHWIGWTIKRYGLAWEGGPVCSPGSWSGRWWLPLNKEWHSMQSGISRTIVKRVRKYLAVYSSLRYIKYCIMLCSHDRRICKEWWSLSVVYDVYTGQMTLQKSYCLKEFLNTYTNALKGMRSVQKVKFQAKRYDLKNNEKKVVTGNWYDVNWCGTA